MEQKKMMIKTFRSTLLASALLAVIGPANAIPSLQLGIVGGTYDSASETVIAPGNPFQLVAILTPQNNDDIAALLAKNYYVSAALLPKAPSAGGDFGSFVFDGATIDATADMFFGTPPLDDAYAALYGDLSPHDIFETYFSEFEFKFASTQTLSGCSVNTQDNPGLSGCTLGGAGGSQYYAAFDVDTTLLESYRLHFDLYNQDIRCFNIEKGKDAVEACVASRDDFAPFSHDAQSSSTSTSTSTSTSSNGNQVPEPGTLTLLGLGLLGLGYGRRLAKKK